MYSSDAVVKWFAEAGWFTILIFGLSVPIILIAFLVSPSLMTQKPKCYFSLVFLTLALAWVLKYESYYMTHIILVNGYDCFIRGFVSAIAVYVTGKYYTCPKPPAPCDVHSGAEQVINSALYGVMICVVVCLVMNWIFDMETQFKLMTGWTLKYKALDVHDFFKIWHSLF